jgi:hypothetical protein
MKRRVAWSLLTLVVLVGVFLNSQPASSSPSNRNKPVPTAIPLAAAPDYWNALPTAGANVFPFNTLPATGKKVQWIVAAGEFNQPSAAPAGNITSIWYRPNAACNATYTTLTIRMANVSTSTFITVGAFYAGAMTTVLSQNTTIAQPVALTWTEIPLTTPFPYDPAQNLIIEVSQCGFTGTGFNINQQAFGSAPDYRRQFSDAASVCGVTALATGGDLNVAGIGITVGAACTPDNTPPVISCPGGITRFTDSGQLTATVNPGVPVVTDNCALLSVTGVRSDGKALNAPYPIGVTTITWTAKDTSNNPASCGQSIAVMVPSGGRRRP